MHRYILSASIAALLAGAPAYAEQPRQEEEIVVTAPLEGALIESLQGVSIIRRDALAASLNGGLGDTLASQPGIASTAFGAGASRPIIRGLGEDRVRVLQNGIGAIDASTASPDHAVTSDGLDADRIEVLRGAAALAYGGNAVGGGVNVIDQSIPTRAIEGLEGEILGAYSSVDEGRQGALRLGLGAGPFALRLSAAQRETDAYDIPGFAAREDHDHDHEHEDEEEHAHEEPAFGVAPNTWTQYEAYALGGSYVGDWGFVGLAVRRTEGEYGLLGHDHAHEHEHEEEEEEEEDHEHEEGPNLSRLAYEQTRYELRGDVRLGLGAFDRLDFALQHADYEHTEYEADGAPGTRFFSDGWEGRLETHHGGERLEGAIGLQFSDVNFSAEGEEAFIAPSTTRDIGVFVIERYDLGGWGLEGGLRFEQRELDNAEFGSRDFETLSASAGVFVRPMQNLFIAATIANTERAPTAFELFANGAHVATDNYELGDPNLDTETALSIELSARHTTPRFALEANLFGIDYAGYIALVDRGDYFWFDHDDSGFVDDDHDAPEGAEVLPVFHFIQQDASFIGGEISGRALLFDVGAFAITGVASYDMVRADFVGGESLPRIPADTLTLRLEAESPHWGGFVEHAETAAQRRTASFETDTDGYSFINAGLAYRPYGDSRITLRLDGRNLSDEEARAHSSFLKNELPLPGRNIRFTVLARF
ncbi:MAG TPA: TonB-dependent receptor [Terricaulis sp.]|nr:TonB-dependent receptor [Terricaulis sp.]